MSNADYIKRKRQQIEEYLEAQLVLGEISKEDAQKKYAEAIEKLKKMEDFKEVTLDSL